MKVIKVGCDNPKCRTLGEPEGIGDDGEPYPPYGWVSAQVHWMGCGPSVTVVVCKVKCLPNAIDNAEQDERERGNR